MNGENFLWALLALGAALVLAGIGALLSPGARLRRRLRRTHGRIVSKSHRPSVKFSVKVPKE